MAKTSAQPYRLGRSVVGDPPEERAPGARRSAASRRSRRSSRPPPEIASTRSGRRGASRAAASMATSKPLRGTRREIDTISSASTGQAEAAGGRRRRSAGVERPEALDVDAGRHDGDRQRAARRPARPRGRRTRPADTTWRARRSTLPSACLVPGKPARHRDLGAVQHDVVGQLAATGRRARAARPGRARRGRRRPRGPGRRCGAPSTGAGSSTGSRVRSMRYGLGAVELRGAVVRAGQHGEAVGRQAPPPLPQQRLDPADLRREVVRHQQVLHRAATPPARSATDSPSRSLAQRACSARTGSAPSRYRASVAATRASSPVGRVAEHDEGVAAQPARIAAGDVPAPVAVEQRAVVGVEQVEHVDPGLGVGRRAGAGGGGRGGRSAGTPPGSRRSRTGGRRRPDAARGRSSPAAAGPRRGSGWRRSRRGRRSPRSGRRRGSGGTTRSRRPPARRRLGRPPS